MKMSTWSLTYQQSVFQRQQSKTFSKSFTYKMAAKTSWHRYGTKLRHCHPMYKQLWKLPKLARAAVFIPDIFGGKFPPPKKNLQFPKRLPNCVLEITSLSPQAYVLPCDRTRRLCGSRSPARRRRRRRERRSTGACRWTPLARRTSCGVAVAAAGRLLGHIAGHTRWTRTAPVLWVVPSTPEAAQCQSRSVHWRTSERHLHADNTDMGDCYTPLHPRQR